MKWIKAIGFLLVLSFCSSQLLWSQEQSSFPPTRIVELSWENWQQLVTAQKTLDDWQKLLRTSTGRGMQWWLTATAEYERMKSSWETIRLDLEKEKIFSQTLSDRVTELRLQATSLLESLRRAKSEALKIEIGEHIAWGIEGLAGVGLVAYGVVKGDAVLVATGCVMVLAATGHFINLY